MVWSYYVLIIDLLQTCSFPRHNSQNYCDFFLSAVNALILTAPIHHRGSIWWTGDNGKFSIFVLVKNNSHILDSLKSSFSANFNFLTIPIWVKKDDSFSLKVTFKWSLSLSPDLSPTWPASPVWPCHPLWEVWGEDTGPCRKPLPHSQRVGCGPQDRLGHWSGPRSAGRTPKKQHNIYIE